MSDPTLVSPPTFSMSVTEVQTLSFNPVAYLSEGQSVADVTSSLTETSSNQTTSPTNAPTISDGNVIQVISGADDLAANGTYRLRITFTASPSVNVWTMDLLITAVA